MQRKLILSLFVLLCVIRSMAQTSGPLLVQNDACCPVRVEAFSTDEWPCNIPGGIPNYGTGITVIPAHSTYIFPAPPPSPLMKPTKWLGARVMHICLNNGVSVGLPGCWPSGTGNTFYGDPAGCDECNDVHSYGGYTVTYMPALGKLRIIGGPDCPSDDGGNAGGQ